MSISLGIGIALWLLMVFITENTLHRNASITQKWHFEFKPYIVKSNVTVRRKGLEQNQSLI